MTLRNYLTDNHDVVNINSMELTVRQFAARLGVDPSRIRQMVVAGELKPRYLNPRMMLIDERQLSKAMKRRKPGRPWPKKRKGGKK